MTNQVIQQTENEVNFIKELKLNDLVDSMRFIDVYQSLVLLQNGSTKETYKGPQVVHLDDYQKRSKDSLSEEIRLYLINEQNILFETKKTSFSFESMDFLYRIFFTNRCDYSYKLKLIDIGKFIETFFQSKNQLSYASIIKLLSPRIDYSIKKCFLFVMRNHNSSFLNAPRYLMEINALINQDLSLRISDMGLGVELSIDSIDFVESDSVKQLKSILLKSKEMELLDYSFQQENLIDFIQIIEEREVES